MVIIGVIHPVTQKDITDSCRATTFLSKASPARTSETRADQAGQLVTPTLTAWDLYLPGTESQSTAVKLSEKWMKATEYTRFS